MGELRLFLGCSFETTILSTPELDGAWEADCQPVGLSKALLGGGWHILAPALGCLLGRDRGSLPKSVGGDWSSLHSSVGQSHGFEKKMRFGQGAMLVKVLKASNRFVCVLIDSRQVSRPNLLPCGQHIIPPPIP